MPSHWLVIEPLLNRCDHNQLTSNQQAGNLLPGIALDLSLRAWLCDRRWPDFDDCDAVSVPIIEANARCSDAEERCGIGESLSARRGSWVVEGLMDSRVP